MYSLDLSYGQLDWASDMSIDMLISGPTQHGTASVADLVQMNPFMAFCLYVAARVFIHVLKKSPNEAVIRSSLEFLLVAMQQFRKVNPLSESFLIQLGLDSQGTGVDFLLQNPSHSASQSWSSMSTIAKLELIVSSPPFRNFQVIYVRLTLA